jgi:hypothetical protein
MAALSHQSAANETSNYWVKSAAGGESITSPLFIQETAGGGGNASVLITSNTGASYGMANGTPSIILEQSIPFIALDSGGIQQSLVAFPNEVEVRQKLVVADNVGTLTSASIEPTNAGAKIYSGTGYLNIGSNSNFVFNDTEGFEYISNGMAFVAQENAAFLASNANIIGGMAANGTALAIGVDTNFSNTNSTSILIPATKQVEIRSGELYVNDPVTPSNFVKITDVAGDGYIDLVSNGLLFPTIQMTTATLNCVASNTRFGPAGLTFAQITGGQFLTFYNPSNVGGAGMYQLPSGQLVISNLTSNTPAGRIKMSVSAGDAVIVNPDGIVDFPLGINISNSQLAVQSITIGGNSTLSGLPNPQTLTILDYTINPFVATTAGLYQVGSNITFSNVNGVDMTACRQVKLRFYGDVIGLGGSVSDAWGYVYAGATPADTIWFSIWAGTPGSGTNYGLNIIGQDTLGAAPSINFFPYYGPVRTLEYVVEPNLNPVVSLALFKNANGAVGLNVAGTNVYCDVTPIL